MINTGNGLIVKVNQSEYWEGNQIQVSTWKRHSYGYDQANKRCCYSYSIKVLIDTCSIRNTVQQETLSNIKYSQDDGLNQAICCVIVIIMLCVHVLTSIGRL